MHVEYRPHHYHQLQIHSSQCLDVSQLIPGLCNDSNIRLVDEFGQVSTTTGRVEICNNNVWGTVCDNGLSANEATVICGQLGPYREGTCTSMDTTVCYFMCL